MFNQEVRTIIAAVLAAISRASTLKSAMMLSPDSVATMTRSPADRDSTNVNSGAYIGPCRASAVTTRVLQQFDNIITQR